ncbi:hypothetical protein [Arthrobacter sp. efr-133-TYG-118]|uniref:hypothetical protein n=1 Tax=Arthrobacter sp. efr-133-TYG-118 TaxID=3040279 RepID=UPI00254B4C52|nr:hypothetical protein [Arthrobacter sp. efr-133-TYG-118]
MSEKSASFGEQGIDRLLDEAGLDEAYEIRTELLELRDLASSRPQPSAAVQALMAPARVTAAPVEALAPVEAVTAVETVAPVGAASRAAAAPLDELAARRRKKGRLTFAAVAVAASLAAGATAAAASDGGIPGTIEHLGAVVGSVVSQLSPGSGGKAPQQGTRPEPGPMVTTGTSIPASPSPESSNPDAQNNNTHPSPHATPSATAPGSESDPRNGLHDITKGRPGAITIPTPAVPTPTLPLPQPVPSEILPGNPVKP